jgi:hypothetical protein
VNDTSSSPENLPPPAFSISPGRRVLRDLALGVVLHRRLEVLLGRLALLGRRVDERAGIAGLDLPRPAIEIDGDAERHVAHRGLVLEPLVGLARAPSPRRACSRRTPPGRQECDRHEATRSAMTTMISISVIPRRARFRLRTGTAFVTGRLRRARSSSRRRRCRSRPRPRPSRARRSRTRSPTACRG